MEQRKKVAKWSKYIADNAALQVGVLKRTLEPQEPAEAAEMPFVGGTHEADDVADSRFAGMDWSQIGVQDS